VGNPTLRVAIFKTEEGNNMRVDKWLSAVNVVKRRTIATDMLKSGVVMINDMKAKASKDVKIGDKVTIEYLKGPKSYEVLQIPTTKTIPKSKKEEYVKAL
jgi:ribosomal 50S subunit-recycling heat shock protein